jgi:uncharacterized surface protein with fasciclin (FAS1) repeats
MSMKNFNIKATFLFLAGSLFFAACDKRDKNEIRPSGFPDNLVEVAQAQGLNTFAAAMKAANMTNELDFLGQYTVLAPNDAAFAAAGLTTANVGSIPADALRTALRNHILPGRTVSANLLPGPNAGYTNMNREIVFTSTFVPPVATQFLGTFFNGKKVLKADILANNGVIHVVDAVLLPPANTLSAAIAANPNLSYFGAAVTTSGLSLSQTAAFTVFAPNNAAFIAAGYPTIASITGASPAALLSIVRTHVVPSSGTAAPTYAGRIFSNLFRPTTTVNSQNGPLTLDVSASGVPSVKSLGISTPAGIVNSDGLYRSAVAAGAANVIHVIDRVLIP